VSGKPITQGSVSPIPYRRKGGKLGVSVFQKPELLSWRDNIKNTFFDKYPELKDAPNFDKSTPLKATLVFGLEKPKTVKRTNVTTKPDLDKLIRAVFDALTGVAYVDDSQVVCICNTRKIYTIGTGWVLIRIERYIEGDESYEVK